VVAGLFVIDLALGRDHRAFVGAFVGDADELRDADEIAFNRQRLVYLERLLAVNALGSETRAAFPQPCVRRSEDDGHRE
jgi:hypothetical protein